MPDFSLLDNQDHLGNSYFPGVDQTTIIEKEIWDEILRVLQAAIQADPSTEGNNTIDPEGDFRALVINAFPTGDKVAAHIQSISNRVVSTSTNYAVNNTDHTVLVDTTAGNITVTLPPAADNSGRVVYIKKTAGPNVVGTNDVVIATTGVETIDGDADARIGFLYTTARAVSDGANWWLT